MPKLTQKQVIKAVKGLKMIKPNQEWVSLLKSQILTEQPFERTISVITAKKIGLIEILKSAIFQRKMAYAFASFVFVITGIFGFAQYTMPGDLLFPIRKASEQSQAALTFQTGLKQNMTALNNRISDLTQASKQGRQDSIPSTIVEIKSDITELAKTLKDNPTNSTQVIKDIASSLKTLASVPGTDLSGMQGVNDLYQIVVESQINDLEKQTLTDKQKEALVKAKELYSQEEYSEALETILLIGN
jgi:AAA+ ATPase superfamily predicted ATPase